MAYLFNSGWELYADAQYTSGSPLVVTSGAPVKLTNDGLGSLTNTTQQVAGLTPMWDATNNKAVHTFEGQLISYRLFMMVKPDQIDKRVIISAKEVGGSINIYENSVTLVKGAGVAQAVTIWFPIFADAGTVANGIEFYIEGTSNNTDVYSFTVLGVQEHLPRFGS